MNPVAIISISGLSNSLIEGGVIGDQFVKGESGTLYASGWWLSPDKRIDEGDTVQNVTAGAFTKEEAIDILTSGKALVIHGLPSFQSALDAFGLVRCDKDGNVPEVTP